MTAMKKVAVSVAVVAIVVGGCIATASAARFYLGNTAQDNAVRLCEDRSGITHRVILENSHAHPEMVTAKLCDTLVIENHDDTQRRIAFGEHDHHVDYSGVEEKVMNRGGVLSLVLAETGDFVFHDHFDDKVHGHLSVRK